MKTQDILEREKKIITRNRRAEHDFFITQRIECGIALQGTEVKSLRQGRATIQDAYAGFKSTKDEDLYLFNLHIPPYEHTGYGNHEPKRPRKLLLHKREALKLKAAVQEKGITLIPLTLYFSGHLVKVEIGLAKAKKKYDKRESTKEKEVEREIRRKFRY
ncbi:MAG: SsrA-binding protein SmpB [Bacteroidota bacterium]